ncbi:Putative 60S ribosomal protein L3 [Aspergillus calidoustus]|uniref:Large ribosomal subunit protein mL44 n=1 Tax=Aspergillus calidoustus TaxID=454130 RepID=A0A0U5HLU6_ASPCI|nr:Putative 60S ribosomal protein L3 [Aspergillus calidoustus]
MKRLQLQRWSSSALSSRARTGGRLHRHLYSGTRLQSTSSYPSHDQLLGKESRPPTATSDVPKFTKRQLPSPPVEAARESAKLAALHARLYLPSRLPLETLARCLVDASADPNAQFNNQSLSVLGNDLLSNYTSEHLICTYPRLPLTVIFAAMYAYVGPKTLLAMSREWGVEHAAAPGGEVDPGLLQYKRLAPGTKPDAEPLIGTTRPNEDQTTWRRSITSSVVYDNEFGDPEMAASPPAELSDEPFLMNDKSPAPATPEAASATFVRAVVGAIYLHAGRPAAKRFFEQHFLSRQLDISKMFNFQQPARDLTRLCARENYDEPVAKIISETGRRSRTPVFVVGIFSGQDKLGEGTGASLSEARARASVAALKGWYLYSPLEVRVPSAMEEEDAAPWKPVYVDLGEVIV